MHDLPLIIIIFLVICYPLETATFSITPLGKLVSVSLILFYTSINDIYGLITCAIIILYYQSDYVENVEHSLRAVVVDTKQNQREHFDDLGGHLANPPPDHKTYSSYIRGDSSIFEYTSPFISMYDDIIQNTKQTKVQLLEIYNQIKEKGGVEMVKGVYNYYLI